MGPETNPGDIAEVSFPQFACDIARVRADPSFEVQDLVWIAAAMELNIRLTLDADVKPELSGDLDWLQQDMLFGNYGPVQAHLFFRWAKACEEERKFGHYDLLLPSEQTLFSKLLPDDEP